MDFLESIEMPAWLSYGIAGLVVVLFVWWKFKDQLLFAFQNEQVQGTITNWMAMNEGGKRYFYPLITYFTVDGKEMKFRAEERCEGAPMYAPGTTVTVRYHKKDPSIRKVKYPDV